MNMDGDSEGSVKKERGFLLYFEVSKCAGLMADEICRSTQVPDLKGILHQKIFYCLNLIFWIVMGCGIARFGRRGLKTTET